MKKQKICIIGGGLSGIITAITLSKLNLQVELITKNVAKDISSNRTVAISESNYNFLKKKNILNFSSKKIWGCSEKHFRWLNYELSRNGCVEVDTGCSKKNNSVQISFAIDLRVKKQELEFKAGYHRVATPHLTKVDLYYQTGHLPYYAEHMYPIMELKETRETDEAIYISTGQFTWFTEALASSPCHFKVVMTSVPIANLPDFPTPGGGSGSPNSVFL